MHIQSSKLAPLVPPSMQGKTYGELFIPDWGLSNTREITRAPSARIRSLRQLCSRLVQSQACGACGGLRRLPAQDGAHHLGSTDRVRRAFLWMFIRFSRGPPKPCNSSFLGLNRMNNLLKARS
jgi:hypothetical protein